MSEAVMERQMRIKLIGMIAVILTAGLAVGQTTTTNCTAYGSTINCTSNTAPDQRQQQQDLADKIGKAVSDVGTAAIQQNRQNRQYKPYYAYCNKHVPNGQRDACVTRMVTRQQIVDDFNQSFKTHDIAGYAELTDDTLTVHNERASEMRFHMLITDPQVRVSYRTAGIKTLIYTNDSDQRFSYDFVAGHEVTNETVASKP